MANIEITSDEAAEQFTAVHPVRVHCERLALFLVIAAVGLVLQYGLQGYTYARDASQLGLDGAFNWSVFLASISLGGYVWTSLILAAALGLTLVAPGPPGRMGVVVANTLSVAGVVAAALALIGVVESFRAPIGSGFSVPGSNGAGELLQQLALAAGFLPFALVSGFVAYTSWRLLNEGWGSPDVEPDAATGGRVDGAPAAAVDDEAWAKPPGSEAWAPEGER